MFTGIITDVGRVRRVSRAIGAGGGLTLTIATSHDIADIALGASIACSGPCLTVVGIEPGAFSVQASAETLACSTLTEWTEGSPVNLERALRVGDELGGHIVSGHVDGVAQLIERRAEGELVRLVIAAPPDLMPYIAAKGSVALDGVSLTVNEVGADSFGVNLILYTLAHTGFGEARPGQRMNLEIDPLARYVARLLAARPDSAGGVLTMERAPHLLLVEAPYYAHLAALLRDGAERAVATAGATREIVAVPGAFEIPAAIALAARSQPGRFDGYVALGCVIRGETTHYDHICAETARALQDIAARDGLAVGYGILTVENEAQALVRAGPDGRDKGGESVRACLALIALKRRFAGGG